MNRPFLLLLPLAVFIAACASTGTDDSPKDAALRCVKETPTGSNVPVTRCRSKDDAERERDAGVAATEAATRAKIAQPVGAGTP
jgi:hypothetical protein